MKNHLSKIVMALLIVMTLLLLAGCGGTAEAEPQTPEAEVPLEEIVTDQPQEPAPEEKDNPKYPVIELVDIGAITLESVQNDVLKVSYPAGEWTHLEGVDPLSLAYTETLGTNNAMNVNAQLTAEYPGTLSEVDLEGLRGSFEQFEGYINFNVFELRMFNGAPAIYTESVMKYTDEYIDLMLETGAITQQFLDENGGREVLLNIPETAQIYFYTVKDGNLYTYIGTYYNEEQKQIVMDTINIMVQTTEAV